MCGDLAYLGSVPCLNCGYRARHLSSESHFFPRIQVLLRHRAVLGSQSASEHLSFGKCSISSGRLWCDKLTLSGHLMINLLYNIFCRTTIFVSSSTLFPVVFPLSVSVWSWYLPEIERTKESRKGINQKEKERKASRIGHQRMEITFIKYLLYAWHFTRLIYKSENFISVSHLKDSLLIPHFSDEETKRQRGQETYSKSHS